MPTVPPFDPNDIPSGWRVDFSAADDAVNELARTVESLMELIAVFEQDLPVVTDQWSGRFREVFDFESCRVDMGGRAIAQGLFTLAVAIRSRETRRPKTASQRPQRTERSGSGAPV